MHDCKRLDRKKEIEKPSSLAGKSMLRAAAAQKLEAKKQEKTVVKKEESKMGTQYLRKTSYYKRQHGR